MIGSNSEGTGLFALDRCEQVDLVCVPSPPGRDLGSTSFVAATRYCERRRALLDLGSAVELVEHERGRVRRPQRRSRSAGTR